MASHNVFAKLDAALTTRRTTLTRDPNMFTTGEYAEKAGISRGVALSRLNALVATGTIERARVPQLQINRIQVVDGWKFIGTKSKETDKGPSDRDRGKGDKGRAANGRRGESTGRKVMGPGA
jgi:hypothetical protein